MIHAANSGGGYCSTPTTEPAYAQVYNNGGGLWPAGAAGDFSLPGTNGAASTLPLINGGEGNGETPPFASKISINRLLAKTKVWTKAAAARRHDRREDRVKGSYSYAPVARGSGDGERSPCNSGGSGATTTWGDLTPAAGDSSTPTHGGVHHTHYGTGSASGRDDKILDNLFQLLNSPQPTVREKALSTIFHLAQSSPQSRDSILEAGGFVPILNEIQRSGPADVHTARALYHLCLGDPPPPFRLVVQTLPWIQRLLLSSDDEGVLVIVCYVLGELVTDQDPSEASYVHKVIPSPFHVRLVSLLKHESIDVRYRVLRLIRIMANADRLRHGESDCSEILSHNFCILLRRCLMVPELQDEAIAVLQNFMVYHLKDVMREGLVKQYFEIVGSKMGFEMEVVQTLCSMLKQADSQQLRYLHESGCGGIVGRAVADLKLMADRSEELKTLHSKMAQISPTNGSPKRKGSGSSAGSPTAGGSLP